jgi:hypothetical protein
VAVALTGFVIFGAIESALHGALTHFGISRRTSELVSTSLCSVLFGLTLLFGLSAIRERRKHVRENLDRVAEINHEIRNALQIIADSQYDTKQRHREMVLESVARIDLVLTRVLPPRIN